MSRTTTDLYVTYRPYALICAVPGSCEGVWREAVRSPAWPIRCFGSALRLKRAFRICAETTPPRLSFWTRPRYLIFIHSFIHRLFFRKKKRAHQQTQFVTKAQVVRFSDVSFFFMGKPLVRRKMLISSSRPRLFTDFTVRSKHIVGRETRWCAY